jgi:hypothetical protein
MAKELEYYDLPGAPMVRVYKGLLPRVKEIEKVLRDSEANPENYTKFNKWYPWNDLGTMNLAALSGYVPGVKYFDSREANYEESLLQEIYEAYYTSLRHYTKEYGVDDVDTFADGPCFYKYDYGLPAPTPDTPEFHMNYHTDFAFSLKDNPGKKSITTTTMYLNDNYLGGEVVYNIEPRLARPYYKRSEQFTEDEPYISGRAVYTPEAGDVVVFPAGNPEYLSDDGYYFHCVNRVWAGDKYFLSIFSSYEYHGSEEYQAGVEEYGEELWTWLERRRTYNAGFKKKAVSLNDPGRELPST